MAMICPQGHGSFENNLKCPQCGAPLVVQAPPRKVESALSSFAKSDGYKFGQALEGAAAPGEAAARPEDKWYNAPLGRIGAGLLLALGLSYGLLQLCVASREILEQKMNWGNLSGGARLGLFYSLQAVALVAGGILAGVGRRQGTSQGAFVGILSGAAALASILANAVPGIMQTFSSNLLDAKTPEQPVVIQGVPVHLVTLYALPVVHVIFGGLGGLLGSLLWKAPAGLEMPVLIPPTPAPGTGLQAASAGEEAPTLLSGPISWVQVIIGVVVAVLGGAAATKPVQNFLLRFFELKAGSNEQNFVTLTEIFALSIFLGGTIAGATRANGLKQGIIVGFLSGIGMLPFLVTTKAEPKYMLAVIGSSLFLAPLGGWFGTTLLPPAPPPSDVKKSAYE